MGNQYDDTNRGVLWRTREKRSDRSPDYTGKLNVDGVEIQLSAWVRKTKDGKPFISLSVRQAGQAREQRRDDLDVLDE